MNLLVAVNPGKSPLGLLRSARLPAAVWTLAAVLFLADVAALMHSLRGNPFWRTTTDFSLFLNAAYMFAHGGNPYTFAPGNSHGAVVLEKGQGFYGVVPVDPYAYPPLLAEAIRPLTLLGDNTARTLWILLSAIALAASVTLLLRGFGFRVGWHWVALSVALLGASATARVDLYHGQVNFVLLWLMTYGLWLHRRGRAVTAGFAWGLMFVVKPFLGLLLVYLVWRKSWREAVVGGATAGLLFLVSFVPPLLDGYGHFLQVFHGWVRVTHWYAASPRPDNLSLYGLIRRLCVPNPYVHAWITDRSVPGWVGVVVAAALILVYLVSVARNGPAPSAHPGRVLVEAGLVLGLGMAYGPLTEGDHLILLLPVMIGSAWLAWEQRDTGNLAAWRCAAAAWMILLLWLLIPVQLPLFGLPGYADWTPVFGLRILLTGQIGLLVLAASVLTAHALRQEQLCMKGHRP